MESEEEEDSNSLLSLSQSLLQSDNSSNITLSSNQINTWSSPSVVASGEMVNQFSPVSPADSYSSQVLSAGNDDSFNRFYNFRAANANQHANKHCSFIRSDGTSISMDTVFQSPAKLNDGEFGRPENAHGNMYFDHGVDPRGNESYINKDSNGVYRNGEAGQYDNNIQTRLDSMSKVNGINFSQNEGYNINIPLVSDNDGKLDMFEPRSRQNDYVKDMNSLYDQSLNKSAMKMISNSGDLLSSLDRRHLESAATFDNDFEDFSSNSRDFSTSTAKLDSRSNQQSTFHHQQGGFDMCQPSSSHNKQSSLISFIENDTQLINSSLNIESHSKRIPLNTSMGFSNSSCNDYVRSNMTPQKKSNFVQLTDISSDFEPVFHSDFSGHHKLSPESQVNFVTSDSMEDKLVNKQQCKPFTDAKNMNKWSDRPRAHRKMARLLGSDVVKEPFLVHGTDGFEKSNSKSSTDNSISQCKNSYQCVSANDFTANGRTFLTMDEELNLRTSQQQGREFMRRDEALGRNQISQRDLGFMQTTGFSLDSSSLSKESVTNMQFLIQPHLELDLHPSIAMTHPQRDLDLSQHFGLQAVSNDLPNGVNGQDMIAFEQPSLQHINQQDLTLPDPLGLGSHNPQDLNLEAYFITPTDKEVSFGRKCSSQVQRDNTDSDFNIEEFMNHKDIGQNYFDRTDLPQDMTIYQKTEKQLAPPEVFVAPKDRLRVSQSNVDTQSNISELQKELTKSSSKESMKGIRTPRDINRAMEIFQGLQQHEQEEEKRKAEQQRQQQYQCSSIGASPKKTFQNKHLVEQLGISVQPFLGQSSHFIEDQSVNSLLDQSHLLMNDASHQDGHLIQTKYPHKNSLPFHQQPNCTDIAMSMPNKKDTQIPHQLMNNGSYHSLKKHQSAMKELSSNQNTSMFINQHSNLASMLTTNNTHIQEYSFAETASMQCQGHQGELDLMASKFLSHSGNSGLEQPGRKTTDPVVNDNTESIVKVADINTQAFDETYQLATSRQQEDIMMSSRKSLYGMMTREEFCDAVLSTPKQTVKIHQAVLCSMSQYLSTLLLNMKHSPSATGGGGTAPVSPSTVYFAKSVSNQGVLLLVNCDEIKPSSITAFLVFIYLGKAEFSESNVQDLYMLACSLKVTTLEELCKKFMWSSHMSDEHIKVPQLLVFSHKSATRDQSSMAELGTTKVFEDKSVNTVPYSKYMEASTQTDRSTTEAGGGGQEEWVMLKKTKQKTVSPSKCRVLAKSSQSCESPINCKAGKKGWLSPKKPKVDVLLDGLQNSRDNLRENVRQFTNMTAVPEDAHISTEVGVHIAFPQTDDDITVQPKSDISKIPVNHQSKDGYLQTVNHEAQSVSGQLKRTTVEIAAAAAAAKLSAHSYGTRLARGHGKSPVSYATLASVPDKKKPSNMKEKSATAVSKKKDFIKSNPPVESPPSFDVNLELSAPSKSGLLSQPEKKSQANQNSNVSTEELTKPSVKRPFKKSIVHRTQRDEVLRNAFTLSQSASRENCLEMSSLGVKNDFNPLLGNDEYMDAGVNHVSTLIDSLVNTMASECVEMDFQKVISDLNNEINRSPVLTTSAPSSSVSSTSLTSPLKSPQVTVSTSESLSPLKSKPTPQGFRKRLIHMMNSENSTHQQGAQSVGPSNSSTSFSSHSHIEPPSVSSICPSNDQSICEPTLSTTLDRYSSSATIPCTTTCVMEEKPRTKLTAPEQVLEDSGQIRTASLETNTSHALMSIQEEEGTPSPLSNFSLMTDRDLGLKDGQGQAFHHKIFKGKRKSKLRKLALSEAEGNAAKSKRLAVDAENSFIKSRQKKATGSDSEGGGRSKKVASDRPHVLANFRPPPKKRAKMELELMKAAKEAQTGQESNSLAKQKPEVSQACEMVNSVTELAADAGKEEDNTALMDSIEVIKQQTKGMPWRVKRSAMKSLKGSDLRITGTDTVLLEETKLTLALESRAKKSGVKSSLTCTLCQCKFRSARRAVKHMFNHGVSGKELVDNIRLGESEEPEACNVCGYKTKDQSYHYMHYHKYFKHAIPLPMGWKLDRCEICGKECFTKFQLKEHMEAHNDDSQAYICWVCGQSFRSRNNFNSHVFHKHNEIRKYKCKACEKSFKTWTQLKVHVRSHTGDRPFSCTQCDHRSSTQGNMKLHLATHGLDKDKIHQLMEKIAKDVPEMTPETLDQIMDGLAKETPASKKAEEKQPTRKRNTSYQGKKKPKAQDEAGMEKKTRKAAEERKSKSPPSKFEGTELKRIFTQSLSHWSQPKLSMLNQPSADNSKITLDDDKNKLQQVIQRSNGGDRSEILEVGNLSTVPQGHPQQPPTNMPGTTTLFIPLPESDQEPLQQQNSQVLGGLSSSLMGFTIPTFLFAGQPAGLAATLDSSGILTMAGRDVSGGSANAPQAIQLIQLKSSLGGQQFGQEIVAENFIGSFVNFPVTEYTVITSGGENLDGNTVTLEIDLNDQAGGPGRLLTEDDSSIVDKAAGSLVYLECNVGSDKLPVTPDKNEVEVQITSPVLMIAKKE